MTSMRHDATIVVISDVFRISEITMPDVEAFREAMPPEFRPLLVGPVPTPLNGYFTYVFLPDGSKEGWPESDRGDELRSQFRELFAAVHEDGSSPFTGVHVTFGDDYGDPPSASEFGNRVAASDATDTEPDAAVLALATFAMRNHEYDSDSCFPTPGTDCWSWCKACEVLAGLPATVRDAALAAYLEVR